MPIRVANHRPASAPAAGPDSTRRIGAAAASSADTTPPLDSIIRTEPPKPSADSHFWSSSRYGPMTGMVAALHAAVIMRGYSRIWGEISDEMHTGTPSSPRRCVGDAGLVGAVDVGVEQAHRHRLDVGRGQLRGERSEVGVGRLAQHGALGADAFVDLEGAVAGDRRRRELDLQVVHVVAVLVADEQRVAEAGGGDEPRPAGLALDERVGDEGRGVHDRCGDLGRGDARLRQQLGDAGAHAVERCRRAW